MSPPTAVPWLLQPVDLALADVVRDRLDATARPVWDRLARGEPGAAVALAAAGGADVGDAGALRLWAGHLRRNWYPGGGAELSADAPEPPMCPDVRDGGTTDFVAHVATELLSVRALLESASSETLRAQVVERFLGGLGEWGRRSLDADHRHRLDLVSADLLWRAGGHGPAERVRAQAMERADDAGDGLGGALGSLLAADWALAPAAPPEALGLVLQTASPLPLPAADLDRAADALDAVSAAGIVELASAVALRRHVLALERGDLAAAASGLDDLRRAGSPSTLVPTLTAVFDLLLRVRAGRIAGVRADVGGAWSRETGGLLEPVRAWGVAEGSATFVSGLGRIAHRLGVRFEAAGDDERAVSCLTIAAQVVDASGAIGRSEILLALADNDHRRHLLARAQVRMEQLLAAEPPPPTDDAVRWLRAAERVSSLARTLISTATSSPTDRGVRNMRNLTNLIRDAVGAVPTPPDTGTVSVEARFAELARRHADVDIDELTDDTASASTESLAVARLALDNIAGQLAVLDPFSLARVQQARGNVERAGELFTEAAHRAAADPGLAWLGALIARAAGDRAGAVDLYRRNLSTLSIDQAASLALRVDDVEWATQLYEGAGLLDQPTQDWADLLDRAEYELLRDRPARALPHVAAAIGMLEERYRTLRRDPDRVAFLDDSKVPALYVAAARAVADDLATRGGSEAASAEACLPYLDRARSLAALAARDDLAVLDADDARAWRVASTDWASAFDELAHAADLKLDKTAVAARLDASERELHRVEADIERSHPDTFAPSTGLAWLDVTALRTSLGDADACLLHCTVSARDLVVVALTAGDARLYRTTFERVTVEPLARRFWEQCANGTVGTAGDELAALLLTPMHEAIAGCERLVVVASGPLAAVAFHALPFDGQPLGTSHVVSYAPYAAGLAGRALGAPADVSAVVVVGDPAFTDGGTLRRLPGALVEARAIAALHPGSTILAEADATETAVVTASGPHRLLHLAAHGQLNEHAPNASNIVLAGPDRLTVVDLVARDLAGDLVVLSACDSGRGASTLGGDVVGLTRALGLAGASGAVVSLWPVGDLAAAVVMAAFHTEVAAGQPPDVALARAQRGLAAMDRDVLAAAYEALGGDTRAAGSNRRGSPDRPPVPDGAATLDTPVDQRVAQGAHPALGELAGASPMLWAPFVFVHLTGDPLPPRRQRAAT